MFNRLFTFAKKEIVLSLSFVLAILSSFIILPDLEYIDYIDFKVLSLLFCFMTVVAGLRKLGILDSAAKKLIVRAGLLRTLVFILVFICFFTSMFITNDVALITFVPFAIIMLNKAGFREKIIPIVIMQTIAANLGSMCTPIGNPQNLYIYSSYNMNIGEFFEIMISYTLISFVMILICCMLMKNAVIDNTVMRNSDMESTDMESADREKTSIDTMLKNPKLYLTKTKLIQLTFYIILFILSILTVLRVFHYIVPVLFALALGMILDRKILKEVDYCLLATFVCFFVFIGNMSRIDIISSSLKDIIAGRELITGFLSSQIISNVPSAVLLSGFTDNYRDLLVGVNIGGLGTLIASLASLISYKFVATEVPDQKGRYILQFTIINIIFAAVLIMKGLLT